MFDDVANKNASPIEDCQLNEEFGGKFYAKLTETKFLWNFALFLSLQFLI